MLSVVRVKLAIARIFPVATSIRITVPHAASSACNCLRKALLDKFGDHANIGDIRGRGLFLGLELVRDRDTRAAFPPQLGLHKKFKQAAFENGLVCYPAGGTIDGQQGDHILLAPPFIIDTGHIDEIVKKLDKALKATLRTL